MIVQAHALAAEALADEVHNCIAQMDTTRASVMTAHLEACLQGLQALKEALVVYPDIGGVHSTSVNSAGDC